MIQVIWEVVTSNIRVWSNEPCQSKRNLFSGFSVAHLEDVQNHSIICDNYSTILISRASILVSDSEHASRQAGRFFKKGHALHGVVGLSSPHRLSQACEHECTCLSPDLEALTRTENRKRWDREASCVTKNESTWRNAAHGHHKKWFTTFRQRHPPDAGILLTTWSIGLRFPLCTAFCSPVHCLMRWQSPHLPCHSPSCIIQRPIRE